MTGLVDALVEDWSVKAFLWSAILVLYIVVVSYEFIVMETPPRPFLQALLFSTAIMGLLASHHLTWTAISIMIGRKMEKMLWLAPNIYASFREYTLASIAMLITYILYLIYINIKSCD
ncbi:MAG: hypothetical protein LZ173_02035 [Thaumarchaeota archaeon]|jgi:hypothetical protein|nr:hypothetical protein [Candidatus Geocrenenecus arthurdayi]